MVGVYANAAPKPNIMPYVKYKILIFWWNIADRNIPPAVNMPPSNVVIRKPILSVSIPDTGDRKNVVPIVNEPTNAEMK